MRKLLNSLMAVVLSLFFFTSCISTKKIEDRVIQRYGKVEEIKPLRLKPGLHIRSNLDSANKKMLTGTSKTTGFLPLIVFWKWNYLKNYTLNACIAMANFEKTVNNNLQKILTDKNAKYYLELNVEKVPNDIEVKTRNNVIFLGIYAYSWDRMTVQTNDMSLVVSYKLWDGDKEIKKGTITVQEKDRTKTLGFFESWKRATQDYLTRYEDNIISASKIFVNKLAEELKN